MILCWEYLFDHCNFRNKLFEAKLTYIFFILSEQQAIQSIKKLMGWLYLSMKIYRPASSVTWCVDTLVITSTIVHQALILIKTFICIWVKSVSRAALTIKMSRLVDADPILARFVQTLKCDIFFSSEGAWVSQMCLCPSEHFSFWLSLLALLSIWLISNSQT